MKKEEEEEEEEEADGDDDDDDWEQDEQQEDEEELTTRHFYFYLHTRKQSVCLWLFCSPWLLKLFKSSLTLTLGLAKIQGAISSLRKGW